MPNRSDWEDFLEDTGLHDTADAIDYLSKGWGVPSTLTIQIRNLTVFPDRHELITATDDWFIRHPKTCDTQSCELGTEDDVERLLDEHGQGNVYVWDGQQWRHVGGPVGIEP